jgi:hypothetical protein
VTKSGEWKQVNRGQQSTTIDDDDDDDDARPDSRQRLPRAGSCLSLLRASGMYGTESAQLAVQQLQRRPSLTQVVACILPAYLPRPSASRRVACVSNA